MTVNGKVKASRTVRKWHSAPTPRPGPLSKKSLTISKAKTWIDRECGCSSAMGEARLQHTRALAFGPDAFAFKAPAGANRVDDARNFSNRPSPVGFDNPTCPG